MTMPISTPFLTVAQVDELCAPLTQRHAQARPLCAMLGLRGLSRRLAGLPLVGGCPIEGRLNTTRRRFARWLQLK